MDSCEEAIKNGESVNTEELRAAEKDVGVPHQIDLVRRDDDSQSLRRGISAA